MRRVLITGASGQLGMDLQAAFGADGHWMVTAADHGNLDVTQRECVRHACLDLRPDVIIHAGAWTAVDACESDPARAFAVNAWGTRNVAEGARSVGAHVVYISTDYVFDGTSPRPYVEWDAPNPLSVYGRSKLGGERELGPTDAVVRTSWVCGRHGSNMVRTALRLLAGEGQLFFVDDQHGCPTFTDDLAGMVKVLAADTRPGIFHVTNSGSTTWYAFVQAVAAASGADKSRVQPIATADLDPPRPALRPTNSVLDNAALRLSGLGPMPDWHEPLERTVKALRG